jgi:Ca2+:H+ antiporter
MADLGYVRRPGAETSLKLSSVILGWQHSVQAGEIGSREGALSLDCDASFRLAVPREIQRSDLPLWAMCCRKEERRMRRLSLNYLLIFVPIALWLYWSAANPLLVFAVAAVTVVPLSKIVGSATEALGAYLGPTLGGLLNASMGNAPELIIGVFALKNGLITVVKASLTGSIIGNLLLTLGLAMFAGGLRYSRQKFNVQATGLSMSMMFLAVAGLMVPALFHFTSRSAEHEISLQIAAILLLVYVSSLVYTLFTHRKLFEVAEPAELKTVKTHSWKTALGLLAAATLVLALMSEILTDALEPATKQMGINDVFAGIILLATVSNVSGMMNAAVFARKNQMDLAVSSVIGAATQIALLVAPALVLASLLLPIPMDLLFSRLELVALIISIFTARNMTIDGKSDWLEGVMLIAVFVMLAVGFYYAK